MIGRAFSSDLSLWSALPPLTEPDGFGQMEVPQRVTTGNGDLLLFSCEPSQLAPSRLSEGKPTSSCYGLWLEGEPPYAPGDVFALDMPNLYSVRAVKDPDGNWVVLGFELENESGGFAGRISDPIPLENVLLGV